MILRRWTTLTVSALVATSVAAQDFGNQADQEYASQLWQVMEEGRLVGSDAIQALPYSGGDPHGAVLQTFYTSATIGEETGTLVVKRNYGPGGATADSVLADPQEQLAAVTIMFRRDEGYAPDSGDWFWAKYLPDGTLDQTPDGTPLAGLAAGCISCHSTAPGEDYLYTTDAAFD